MIEEIMKHAPKGATHWQAGVYYKENDYGVWSMWKGYWESAFKWPDGFMTPLNEVSMFKVGKKVVSKAQDTISAVFEITAIHDDYMESFEYELNYGFWRLAEPEEIAAGHRIDNDIGDDSHIENHVSPNCKQVK